ncbi:hypothetical protein Pcinc_016188 [Petrolisthes cinctipes]|uniref:Sushi domain-containing protein n=1 Tax=Petrolisthes cinctipes TaxID=88211 RepID=A0AAE1FRH9_PETCI|nr:hypothetical protein Pcinc_016188 [Petrolisthes cinctipes]
MVVMVVVIVGEAGGMEGSSHHNTDPGRFTQPYDIKKHQQGPHRHHTHDDPLKYTPQQQDINPAPATTATPTSGRGVNEEQERVERRWLGSGEDGRNLHKRHLHPNSLAPASLWYPFNMPWLSSSHRFSGLSHSPHIWHAHQVHLHHKQMMARLHQHMLEMNRRVTSIDAHQHQPYNSHFNGKQQKKQQQQRWQTNNHQQQALHSERSDPLVQHRENQLTGMKKNHNRHLSHSTQHNTRHLMLSSNTNDHQHPREDERRVHQFKITRGLENHIPEDVEVFKGQEPSTGDPIYTPPPTTTPASSTTTTPHFTHVRKSRRNCTRIHGDRVPPRPSHHRTSIHHSRHRSPSFVFSSSDGSNYNEPSRHYLPLSHRHSNTPLTTESSTSNNQHHHQHFSSSFSPSPSTHWKADTEGQNRIFSTNVKNHLHPLNPSPRRDDNPNPPCIKCPPDTHVEAPKGRDCVYAHTPSPFTCTSGWVRTHVLSGPRPGQRLLEGQYLMVLMVGTAEHPLTTCTLHYDVTVRKCGELPTVLGLRVWCTAGRAWGSHCTFRCDDGLSLQGQDITSCTHRQQPRWSNPPPTCTKRREADKEGCSAPTEVPGGHYKCHTPVATPTNIPIPKDDPQATRDIRHTNINMVNSISYREGTVCKLECEKGWTVLVSQRGRHRLTCTPGAHWDHRPPLCYLKVAPTLSRGECEDLTLARSHSLLSFMPLPIFTTASGVAARVTCLLEVESGGRNIRTCTAQDPELETTSTCTYTITVPDEYRDPDVIFIRNPSVGVGVKPSYPTADQPYPNHTKHQTTFTQYKDLPLHQLDNEYEDEDGYNYDVFDEDYGGGIDSYEEFGQ